MSYYKNISCTIEFFDFGDDTFQKIHNHAKKYGLYKKNVDDKPLPGFSKCEYYWSGYTFTWSDDDLEEWLMQFAKEIRKIIGHHEVFIDIHS